ncbi:MAG: polysaccharide biosynthesis/export family protein [Lentisphaeria bacterium]|nr:polysaccharide biosynthesis/export family protein [Candidatus Neomarinimicrobiota bacterium]MCF7841815.1 polysaccharide biosynthesis/export family protein [Lentisphaeria bacterium]
MRRLILLCTLVLPLLVYGQRFGTSQTPGDQRTVITPEQPSENPIPVELIALERPVDPKSYRVGPGDQIAISIQTSEMLDKVLTISPTGYLMIPGVGKVDLRNLTLDATIERINQAILLNFKNARVNSELVGLRKFKIAIVGAVKTPGYYTVSAVNRVSDVIELAEPRQMALLNQVELERIDGSVLNLDITNFYAQGDLHHNPQLTEGDRIRVKYGDLDEHAIVIRGAVQNTGYDYLKPGETLGELIARRIDFRSNADLENIKIVRRVSGSIEFITVAPEEFSAFKLQPGDDIEFLYEKPVNVQGYVASSGSFNFIPGYTAADYVTLAGGLLPSGTMNGIKISRVDGAVLHGEDVVIQRGDIIEVPRSWMNIAFGEISVIEFFSTMATLVLAILAVK